MTIIEKILLELCAKDVVEDGIPDFTNEKHLLALNEVLVELNWPMDARGELLYTLMEVEKTSFVGITKDKKRRYFKDKEALDKAVDAGSVTLPDEKEKEKDDDEKQSSDTKVTDFERPGSEKEDEPKDEPKEKPKVLNPAFSYAMVPAKTIKSDQLNLFPYFFLIGQRRRLALSKFVLSGQESCGENLCEPTFGLPSNSL